MQNEFFSKSSKWLKISWTTLDKFRICTLIIIIQYFVYNNAIHFMRNILCGHLLIASTLTYPNCMPPNLGYWLESALFSMFSYIHICIMYISQFKHQYYEYISKQQSPYYRQNRQMYNVHTSFKYRNFVGIWKVIWLLTL